MDDTIHKNFPEIILIISSYYVNFNEGCHRSHPLNLRLSLCPPPSLDSVTPSEPKMPHTRGVWISNWKNCQNSPCDRNPGFRGPNGFHVPPCVWNIFFHNGSWSNIYIKPHSLRLRKNSYKNWIFLDFLFSKIFFGELGLFYGLGEVLACLKGVLYSTKKYFGTSRLIKINIFSPRVRNFNPLFWVFFYVLYHPNFYPPQQSSRTHGLQIVGGARLANWVLVK